MLNNCLLCETLLKNTDACTEDGSVLCVITPWSLLWVRRREDGVESMSCDVGHLKYGTKDLYI